MSRTPLFVAFAVVVASTPAMAVEGAVGRTLPGVWIMPQAGVVGPEPGFSVITLPIGYMGSIGGGRAVPEGGVLFTNVDTNISSNYIVTKYVYKTEGTKVSWSSMFLTPINWVGSSASAVSNTLSRDVSRSNGGIGDVVFAPLNAGIHFSENSNLSLGMMVFAPTGLFRPGNISNLGMGEWTLMPNCGYTYLWKDRGLEFDSFLGFDFYSENTQTNYTSGTMFHWDGMVTQYFSKRFGVGGIISNLTQINKDKGPIADFLHGFQGSGWGAGPTLIYVAKTEKPQIALNLRWINEFAMTNLMKGNMFEFGLSVTMK